jgi:hypothetical protein
LDGIHIWNWQVDWNLLTQFRTVKRLYIHSECREALTPSFSNMTTLTELTLKGPGISDNCMLYMRNLRNLETLALRDTSVSDAGMLHLLPLHRLRNLILTGSRITHKSTPLFRSLPTLQYLDISGTILARSGVDLDLSNVVVRNSSAP